MKKFNKKETNETEYQAPEPVDSTLELFEIKNLTETTFPVQVFDDTGNVVNINLRVQGRFGQKPPVIASTGITDQLRDLEKKRMIKLVKVNQEKI